MIILTNEKLIELTTKHIAMLELRFKNARSSFKKACVRDSIEYFEAVRFRLEQLQVFELRKRQGGKL